MVSLWLPSFLPTAKRPMKDLTRKRNPMKPTLRSLVMSSRIIAGDSVSAGSA